MRVLNVNSILDPVTGGGTAERTLQLSRAMRKAGIDCRVLTTRAGLTPETLDMMQDVEIEALPCLNRRFRIPLCSSRRLRLLVEDADIVHIMDHWTVLNVQVARTARRLGKPYVVCPAGALPVFGRSRALKAAYNRAFGFDLIRNASGHVAITVLERQQFEPYGVDPRRVTVIPNGVDCGGVMPRDDEALRRRLGLGTQPFILFVGRLNAIKGPDLLLRAFLDAGKSLEGIHLVLVGPDGGMLSQLLAMTREAGAEERVHFTGYLGGPEKDLAYAAAKLVVVPSRQEAMSIVVLEAGAAETPEVMTDQCGFDEVADVEGGIVVAPTAGALKEGLLRLLDSGAALRAMGMRLRTHVERNYSWDIAVGKYRTLYEGIIRGTEKA